MNREAPPRLSGKEVVALRLLVDAKRDLYGLELVERANGELKRGTVYVTLDRMEDKGYVKSHTASEAPEGAATRRLYKPTGLGARALAAYEAGARVFAGGAA